MEFLGDPLADLRAFPVEANAVRMAAAGFDVRVLGPSAGYGRAGKVVQCNGVDGTAGPADSNPIVTPRIALFRGKGAAYPYCAYYAHALAALGYVFDVVDGKDIAAGALGHVDLFVIPGGFAIWGIDQCDDVTGADQAVRRFLKEGGSAIGSCGGAFYLSSGRPGWLETAPATPRFTHEYLRSGAGLVSIALEDDPLGSGLPPLIEMPYYHGPIYEEVRAPSVVNGRFRALSMPATIPIDNPLGEAQFDSHMAARAAIVSVESQEGKAVLFSAHPEMGDLVRKYIAMQSYVARYLPIRGEDVMRSTLDHYAPNTPPCFRLIFNAVQWCASSKATSSDGQKLVPAKQNGSADRLKHAVLDRLGSIECGKGELAALLDRERDRLIAGAKALQRVPLHQDEGMEVIFKDAAHHLAENRDADPCRSLLSAELALRLMETAHHRGELARRVAGDEGFQ